MTLYQFLVFNKRYTEEEAREVCIRFEFSKGLKDKVRNDIKEYYRKYYEKSKKSCFVLKVNDFLPYYSIPVEQLKAYKE